MIAKLALAGAMVLASTSAPKNISLEQAIDICRTSLFLDPAKGEAMFAAVPDDQKKAVAAVCIGYESGANDAFEVLKYQREHEA